LRTLIFAPSADSCCHRLLEKLIHLDPASTPNASTPRGGYISDLTLPFSLPG
jgi:hypothetical protein